MYGTALPERQKLQGEGVIVQYAESFSSEGEIKKKENTIKDKNKSKFVPESDAV